MKDLNLQALTKYSMAAPRYTSYPTANEFNNNFTLENLMQCFKDSSTIYKDIPLSLYTHLPFCKSACYFCGCNVIYTNSEDKKNRYISYLKKELDLLKDSMDCSKNVVQFHFGGGTPTFFNARQLEEVIVLIRNVFNNFDSNAEISCEIDPRHFEKEQMAVLKEYGFNRISFGVQDFDEKVQRAINRIQSVDLVKNCVNIARDSGIKSINFDLIYGLPFQNVKSFMNTLEEVIKLSPDRLAIFHYAHVPWVKKTMEKIKEETLPPSEVKIEILQKTIEFLHANGYEMIGMDHFAKKNDELYISKEKGILRRNFQGYTAKGFSHTIGIGLTSISEGVNYYAQNFKDIKSYEMSIDNGKLPLNIGILLKKEDILRKKIIMGIMNNLFINFKDIEKEFNIDFKAHFKNELAQLLPLQDLGFLTINENDICVSKIGNFVVRNIALAFDEYLPSNQKRQFSKTL